MKIVKLRALISIRPNLMPAVFCPSVLDSMLMMTSRTAAHKGPGGAPAVLDTLVAVDGNRLHFRVIDGGELDMLLESGGGFDLSERIDIGPQLARETGAAVDCC